MSASVLVCVSHATTMASNEPRAPKSMMATAAPASFASIQSPATKPSQGSPSTITERARLLAAADTSKSPAAEVGLLRSALAGGGYELPASTSLGEQVLAYPLDVLPNLLLVSMALEKLSARLAEK
jgi:hypothetical protein